MSKIIEVREYAGLTEDESVLVDQLDDILPKGTENHVMVIKVACALLIAKYEHHPHNPRVCTQCAELSDL